MLSNKLKKIRIYKGYSQERLAKRAGLSLRTVQRVENGETQPRGDTLIRLTNALGVTPDEIMEWKKTEYKTYLSVFNLSALSFILFPLLGIILPLILWITKRDQIQKLNKIGKNMLNFQILWTIILFLGFVTYSFWSANYFETVGDISPSIATNFIRPLQWIIATLYGYNLLIILLNAFKISQDKPVWYYPCINFIR